MDVDRQVLTEVIERLERIGVAYMVVGSFAMMPYAPTRRTQDVDLVVQLGAHQLPALQQEFGAEWMVDEGMARQAIEQRRMFNIIHWKLSNKVDFIVLKDDDFAKEQFHRRRVHKDEHGEFYVQSPEDLILSKLLWAKSGGSLRQLEDVRTLLESVTELDRDYIKKWADELDLHKLLAEAREQ